MRRLIWVWVWQGHVVRMGCVCGGVCVLQPLSIFSPMWMFVCVYVHPCVHLEAPMSLEQNQCSLRCTENQKHIEAWRSYMWISKISWNLSFIRLMQSLFLHSICQSFLYFLCHPLSAIITFNLDRGRDVVFPRLCCWHNALGCDVEQANCATVISVFHRLPYHQETGDFLVGIIIKSERWSKLCGISNFPDCLVPLFKGADIINKDHTACCSEQFSRH